MPAREMIGQNMLPSSQSYSVLRLLLVRLTALEFLLYFTDFPENGSWPSPNRPRDQNHPTASIELILRFDENAKHQT